MTSLPANKFFNDVNFASIVDTIKNVYMSDGAMSTLLDFERVLDEADIYAYKNWINGELVEGPTIGRYACKCIFMWPYKLMPDPRGALRLEIVGCKVTFGKSEIDVPVEVKDYEDFVQGTRYPKMHKRKVWFVEVKIPIELMNDIKEGSIDLAGQTIDLSDIEEAYDEDLDKMNMTGAESNTIQDENQGGSSAFGGPEMAPTTTPGIQV
jgi:hypothetical protein